MEALEAAIAFAFLDENPRLTSKTQGHGWSVLTTDNTDLYVWPIDVDAGKVVVTTGLMVRMTSGGYEIGDKHLVIRPPLDLQAPLGTHSADAMCLEAIYKTVLASVTSPGTNRDADKVRVAIGWFTKAWRNTATLLFPERVVYLKTAFEALTGTSTSYKSAAILRSLFEAVPNTAPDDSDKLLWSPSEQPIHARTYQKKDGTQQTDQIRDLQLWFMAFADARNDIIHEGTAATLNYAGPAAAYQSHFVFTAEFLLRAAIKVKLAPFGYPDLWRSAIWRNCEGCVRGGRTSSRGGGRCSPTACRHVKRHDLAQRTPQFPPGKARIPCCGRHLWGVHSGHISNTSFRKWHSESNGRWRQLADEALASFR
jgi:hypothetical protein